MISFFSLVGVTMFILLCLHFFAPLISVEFLVIKALCRLSVQSELIDREIAHIYWQSRKKCKGLKSEKEIISESRYFLVFVFTDDCICKSSEESITSHPNLVVPT